MGRSLSLRKEERYMIDQDARSSERLREKSCEVSFVSHMATRSRVTTTHAIPPLMTTHE